MIEASRNGQEDKVVSLVEAGAEGDPVARNNRYLFDYSAGHYSANDEMHKCRGEIRIIMKTQEVEDVES